MPGLQLYLLIFFLCVLPAGGVRAKELSPEQRLIGEVIRGHYLPHATDFVRRASHLTIAIAELCSNRGAERLQAARFAWVDAMLGWESLGAVAIGPMLERATEANLDFWPARAQMIDAGIARAITDTKALRQTGVAGRGFAALERLLWIPSETPRAYGDRDACAYAMLLARDIHEEGLVLQAGFSEELDAVASAGDAVTSTAELVNQLVVAVEVLRRKRLFNAVAVGNARVFARSISDQAQAAWMMRWRSIASLLGAANGRGMLCALLIERGLQPAAEKLRTAVNAVSNALASASPSRLDSVRSAADALMELRATLQVDVAEGLHIPTKFSDFDGD